MMIKKNFLQDGSDWHESGVEINEIRPSYYEAICTRIEQVPQKEMRQLKSLGYENYLKQIAMGGRNWVIEPLRELQPKSFAVLAENASDYKLGFHWFDSFMRTPPQLDSMIFHGWFEILGRIISVRPEDTTYEEGGSWNCVQSFRAIPNDLAQSWLWRTGGWAIHNSIPGSVMMNRQLIGHPMGQWQSIGMLLSSFNRTWKKKYLPIILEQIPDAVVTKYNPHDGKPYEWQAFRCFLDTRPEGLNGPCGDQFLVVDEHTDQTVYHIHDGDIKHIRILHNPAEAIDAYCAHTLLRIPGRFDFMPWSEPLK